MADQSVPANLTKVTLPPGVTVVGAREASQPNLSGQIVQGMSFSFQLSGGATTSLFIPYSMLSDPGAVSSAIAQRVDAIQQVTGAGPGG